MQPSVPHPSSTSVLPAPASLRATPLAAAILALAGLLAPTPGSGGHLLGQAPTPRPALFTECGVEPAPPPVGLAALWAEGADREPGFEAARERVASGGLARSAVSREWVPIFQMEGLSNYGQRTSPGEERVLGVGPRSELRLLGSWTLLDGSRAWRGREAALGEAAAAAGASAFANSWRAMAALTWVEAAASESTAQARIDHQARIGALEAPVRRRIEVGVESAWELDLLEEALARSERLVAEAEETRASSRMDLSDLVGACVRAPIEVPVGRTATDRTPGDRAEAAGGGTPVASGPEDPEVRRLEVLAQVREAQARAVAAADRWQVALVGSAGPTRSRAFDPGPTEQEYLVGVSGRIGLDLAGVGRTAQRAGLAEAGALRADAESLRAARERERARLELEIEGAAARGPDLDHEVTRAEARLEAARLRWEAGVDGWSPVLQAADRALEARLLRTSWALALARSRIRLAELRGTLDALATDFSLTPEASR